MITIRLLVSGKEDETMAAKKIRWGVFLPPWLLVMATIALDFINHDAFMKALDFLTSLIMENFTWGFCLLAFACVLLTCISYFPLLAKCA